MALSWPEWRRGWPDEMGASTSPLCNRGRCGVYLNNAVNEVMPMIGMVTLNNLTYRGGI